MKTEKEKMLEGRFYNADDPQLLEERLRARDLCFRLNHLSPTSPDTLRDQILTELFGVKTDVYITPPFYCDYGRNIRFGKRVYFNFNCIVLDVAQVNIGNNVLFGPGVQLLTASHPLERKKRNLGLEFGKPIEIGDDVWVGGGVIICPGVTVGPGAVIGAASVVTRDVPADTFAAGNPCKLIRKLE